MIFIIDIIKSINALFDRDAIDPNMIKFFEVTRARAPHTRELHFCAYFSIRSSNKVRRIRSFRQYITPRCNVIREQSSAMSEKYRVTIWKSISKFLASRDIYTHVRSCITESYFIGSGTLLNRSSILSAHKGEDCSFLA